MATTRAFLRLSVVVMMGLVGVRPSVAQTFTSGTATTWTKPSVLLTAFAINKPAQVLDMDDVSQGFPRELARRLENSQQFIVRTSPDLLSLDWQQATPPPAKLLRQLSAYYGSRFIIAGEVRNAGSKIETNLFGLTKKETRAIEVELRLYDASQERLISRYDLSRSVTSDIQVDVGVGRSHVFGGAAFVSTPYGKAIAELIDEAAQLVTANMLEQK